MPNLHIHVHTKDGGPGSGPRPGGGSQQNPNHHVVIGNAGHGRQNAYPKSSEPGLYSKKKAESIATSMNPKPGAGISFGTPIHYHVKHLSEAHKYAGSGEALKGIRRLQEHHGYDTDDSNDGRKSRDVGASSTVGGQTTGYSINTSSDTKDDCDCKTTGDGKVTVSRKPSASKRSGQFTLPRRK